MAMTAKAKLLLRELKTMKADLAFAKERCAQLEEENKVLRECHEKGVGPEDDELVCMFISISTKVHDKARGISIVSCMCVFIACARSYSFTRRGCPRSKKLGWFFCQTRTDILDIWKF